MFDLREDRIHGEAGPGKHGLVTGTQDALDQDLEQLVGAGAEDQRVGRDAKLRRQRLAQVVAGTVGVAVQALRGLDRGVERPSRRSQRRFVRRQLDRTVDPELALELLDRLARRVRLELEDVRLHQVGELHDPPARG